ncbi:hypothetical protein ACFQY5_14820 [Paeniroseomonas aquatica]|uniref:hypothetical protein n=1 Tax=Paeniroseomonas aquatica TaxID=373043 RepID=UPI00361C516B
MAGSGPEAEPRYAETELSYRIISERKPVRGSTSQPAAPRPDAGLEGPHAAPASASAPPGRGPEAQAFATPAAPADGWASMLAAQGLAAAAIGHANLAAAAPPQEATAPQAAAVKQAMPGTAPQRAAEAAAPAQPAAPAEARAAARSEAPAPGEPVAPVKAEIAAPAPPAPRDQAPAAETATAAVAAKAAAVAEKAPSAPSSPWITMSAPPPRRSGSPRRCRSRPRPRSWRRR